MHRRIPAVVGILLALVPATHAKGHLLEERLTPGDCIKVELNLNLKGEMQFTRQDRKQSLPLEASATLVFPERILSVAKSGTAEKTARLYETAKANIAVGKHHNLARLSTNAHRAWGFNESGQLGDGTHSSRATPVTIATQ